jgi:uncharacterized delta-60 repeat protein
VDALFDPNADGIVSSFALQSDGKILVGGGFAKIGGQPRLRIARLHSSGLIDASFNPGANNYVRCLSVQQDGKILVGGHFTSIRSQPRSRIARLHPDGALDAGFNPDSNGSLYAFALQLDGKIIVGGEFTAINGQLRNRIARLHSDGVLDESFDPNANGRVSTIAVQTDGKILLGGEFTMIGGVVRNRLARLHVDGSLDESFNPDARGSVNCLVVLPDGKMVLGGSFAQVVGQTRGGIARLHSDGSLDSTFNPNPNPDVFTSVNSCALQADGKVLIGGAFTTIAGQRRENIARLNADGSLDSTFNPTSVNWTYSLMIQADGNVLAGGNFYSLGGFGRSKIGRLLNGPTTSTLAVTAGSQIDWQRGGSAPEIGQVTFENWNGSEWTSSGVAARVPGGWQAAGLSLPSNSWIRARGRVSGGDNNGSSGLIEQIVSSGGGPFPGISVAENGGTPFVSGQSILEFGNTTWYGNSQLRTITITNTGSAPLESLALQLSGNSAASFAVGPLATTSLGPGQSTSFAVQFNPIVDGLQGATLSISSNHAESLPFQLPLQGVGMRSDPSFNPGPNSSPQSIALQADGKVLVGGGFTSIGGQTRRRIARLHANGTLDAYFNPDVNNVVFSIAVQADGKILIGGDFTTVGGQTRNRIARLHADGSLDESFNPGAGSSVRCIVPQADGSILVGGTFTTLGGQSRNRIARLHHDGSLDQSFNPYASDIVRSIALQPDGKIILGGEFTTLSGQTRLRIARLHPDGSLDEGFTPADAGSVLCLALQADGKIVLGGTFTTVGGQPHSNVARLLADGSVDSSFHADVDVSVSNLAIQADGMILIGGDFSYVGGQPRSRIARIHPDGSPDASFNPGVGVENPLSLSALALQQDGMILVGGTFTTAGGLPRQNLARLLNESAASTLSQTGGSQIDWQRSGTTPELGNVSFDYWTAGVWTNVGPAIRVPGGWQVFGASLPANIWLRARGTSTSGYGNGSLGIIEQIASYGGTPLSEFIVTGNGTIPITSGQGALDLGSVELNKTSLSQTITITNTGSSPLLDFSHRISGVSAGDFIATPPSPSSIDPGESASFTVRFQPTVAHVRSALLAIRFNHPLASAFEIPLTGTGVQTDTTFVPGANDSVHAFGLQADGKIVIGGLFTTIAGQPRNRIARLHPDGSLDPTFNPGADGRINTMAMQSDGKILLGGWFTSLGGQTRNRIARIHPDGSLDESFNPDPNGTVSAMGIQPDGMIVIVGRFTTVAGQPRNRIARLFPDGSLDTSFNPDAGNAAHSVAFQPDGKIIVSGDFTTIGGLTRNRIARLNANGSVDSTFNPNANLAIRCLVIQPDGKILIGGDFTTIGGFTRTRIARLNANGSLDQFFNTDFFSNIVNSLALQADGKILVGFGLNVQSGKLIARLNTNGSIDTSLNHAPNQAVYSLMLQENGRILTGGDFTTIDGQPRSRIARLLTSSASSTLSVTGGDQIQWLRGGTVPEVDHVRFDYWNGSTWVSVGSPVRITGGWQASGLILPANSWIRARGISRGGYNTGSTGPIEQVSFGGTDQTFESWINQPAWNLSGPSSGPLADFDHDGVPNLLEYALGATDPTDRAAAFPVLTSPHLPQPAPQLRITFLRRTGGTEANGSYISGDLTYQPVATTDLTNWNIAPIPVPNPPDLPAAPEGFEWTSYAIPDSPETQSKGFIKLKVDAE